MNKICSQTTIPTVNEDAPACPVTATEECVFMTEARTNPITINPDDNLREVIDRLLLYIITLEERITILETP